MLILSAINPEQALSDDEAELMELDLAAVQQAARKRWNDSITRLKRRYTAILFPF